MVCYGAVWTRQRGHGCGAEVAWIWGSLDGAARRVETRWGPSSRRPPATATVGLPQPAEHDATPSHLASHPTVPIHPAFAPSRALSIQFQAKRGLRFTGDESPRTPGSASLGGRPRSARPRSARRRSARPRRAGSEARAARGVSPVCKAASRERGRHRGAPRRAERNVGRV